MPEILCLISDCYTSTQTQILSVSRPCTVLTSVIYLSNFNVILDIYFSLVHGYQHFWKSPLFPSLGVEDRNRKFSDT
jgi:hypothetical protein